MTRRRRSSISIIALLLTSLSVVPAIPAAVAADDPAARVPEGALVYVGWAGCDQMGAAAKETAVGKTLADPQVRRFFQELHRAVDALLKQEAAKEDAAPVYEAVHRMVMDAFRNSGAVALLDVAVGETGPSVQAVLLLQLGDRAEGFLADFESLLPLAKIPPAEPVTLGGRNLKLLRTPIPMPLIYGVADGLFLLAVGDQTAERVLAVAGDGTGSLARSAGMTAARQKLGGDAGTRASCFYADVAGLYQRAQTLLPMFVPDAGDSAKVWAVLSALGFDTVKSVCCEMHYRERGCYSGMLIQTEGPPRGLFAAGAGGPLQDQQLALIPKDPHWAAAFRLNLGKLYAQGLNLHKSMDAQGAAELAAALGGVQEELGLAIDKDLLDLLGELYVVYDAPANGGFWITGATLIVESPDAARLQGNLRKLFEFLNRKIEEEGGSGRLIVGSMDHRDHKIDYLNVVGAPIPVAPAWTADGNRLIVALYPQMVTVALDRLAQKDLAADSLTANPDFAAAKKVLGGVGSTVTYVNTRRAMEQLYALVLPLAQMGVAMAQAEGFALDISCLPSQQAVTQHLFGHLATTDNLADGVLYESYGPLPLGAPALGESAGGTSLLMASILLPSLSRARSLAKRQVSAANLRGIGMGCMIHANDNQERFPSDLQTLIQNGTITETQLHAPADPTDQVSYVYLAANLRIDRIRYPGMTIIAHERTDLNDGEGVNALFADSHVEFLKPDRFEQLLADSKRDLEAAQQK